MPRNIYALMKQLTALMQHYPLSHRMSEAAPRCVAEIGGWDAHGERWEWQLATTAPSVLKQ